MQEVHTLREVEVMKFFNVQKVRYSVVSALLLLVLSTGAFANVNQQSFNEFKDIMTNKYALGNYVISDWNALFAKYEASLINSTDSNSFATILNDLTIEIGDSHLLVNDNQFGGYSSGQ